MKTIFTSNWGILGDERIPRWPSKIGEPRPINVEICTWKGISAGAKHYEVHVYEDDNQWWCEEENAWVKISTDSSRLGYSMKASVLKAGEAVKMAKTFIELILGKLPTKKSSDVVVMWHGTGCPSWANKVP